jgi:hypothetical protein
MSGVTSLSINTETAAADAAAASTPAAPAVERPEFIPEKFWRGNVEESAKAMAQSYVELERKQSGGKPEGTGATADAVTPPTAPTTTESTPAPTAEQSAATAAIESALTKAAGTAEDLKATLDWARANATDAQKALFDAALDAGNPAAVELAFASIKGAYTEAMGTQGARVTGEAVPTTVGAKPFASQDEIIEFVNSPAYKRGDKRAHAEYEARMKVTNW